MSPQDALVIYRASALNAYIARGFLYEDAVPLANEVALRMQEEINRQELLNSEKYA